MSGNCHRMRAPLSSSSPNRALLCVNTGSLHSTGMSLLPLLLLFMLGASSPAQQHRQVNYAGNQGFGAGVGCTANCGVQANTNGALQNFDAAQVSAGNCAAVTTSNTATENNPLCATSVIEAGDTITWVFDDAAALPAQHSATSGTCPGGTCPASCPAPCLFDTGIQSTLGTSYTPVPNPFTSANVYPYFCLVHGVGMLGTVIVQDYSIGFSNATLFAYKGVTTPFTAVLNGLPSASNPYNYSVNLSSQNVTTGLNVTFPGGGSATPSGTGTNVTVNASASAGGDYTFQVLGVGGVNDPDNLTRNSPTATLHVIDLILNGGLGAITLSSNGN